MFDLAIITGGSTEAAFAMALLNGISLTDELAVGANLEPPIVVNNNIVSNYAVNGFIPASAITAEQYNNTIENEGIGYWGIERDFVIS